MSGVREKRPEIEEEERDKENRDEKVDDRSDSRMAVGMLLTQVIDNSNNFESGSLCLPSQELS